MKFKFIKYFFLIIFAQIAVLLITPMFGSSFVFKNFYEPILIFGLKFFKMGHADVILPLFMLTPILSVYSVVLSFLLVCTPFREQVFLPIRSELKKLVTRIRAKINGR